MTPGDIQLVDQIYSGYSERFNSAYSDQHLRELTRECLVGLGWSETKATKAAQYAQLI